MQKFCTKYTKLSYKAAPACRWSRKLSKVAPQSCSPKLLPKLFPGAAPQSCAPKLFSKAIVPKLLFCKSVRQNGPPKLFHKATPESYATARARKGNKHSVCGRRRVRQAGNLAEVHNRKIPLNWWVGTLTPPFHKNTVYVMVGYRYIYIEWILFWAYMLWNTTIVLPSRPDMQKNVLPLCYRNGIKIKSWNQENLIYILWNGLHLKGIILRYLKIF